ncbi:MAG: histidinol-phosphate transaminase [Marinilabiliales bacterium]|nr:histidinol-phosphate transaminase [Marinilabiliales bacterium]
MTFSIHHLIRDNIRQLHPYSSARDEFTGNASVFLDANENPFNAPLNRYPDPRQLRLKERLSAIKQLPAGNIFLGNGSDEPIDLLYRAFCEPRLDNVVAIAPTYGMYKVAADINAVDYREVLLDGEYGLDPESLLKATDEHTKLIFLCSPNNPTGNALSGVALEKILTEFPGIVVVDEAYIDFCPETTLVPRLSEFPNLVILQTLSKAWGVAAIRLGMAFASPEIIGVLSKIKYPYNINQLTQQHALEILQSTQKKDEWVQELLQERKKLESALTTLPHVLQVYPSDANFILVRTRGAKNIYQYLTNQGIIVRDRSKIVLCGECLRITVGTAEENQKLLAEWRRMA